jgi:hypothetical protein
MRVIFSKIVIILLKNKASFIYDIKKGFLQGNNVIIYTRNEENSRDFFRFYGKGFIFSKSL